MQPHEHIAFALDVDTQEQATQLIALLEEHVGAFKVGLELFIKTGKVFNEHTSRPIILDLKLHDIPETVARAVKTGGDRGVKYMTIHVQQKKTLEMAVKAAEPFGITLLMVTVLTSMGDEDIKGLDYNPDHNILGRVQYLASFGYNNGIRGFVCSPIEIRTLKNFYPDAFYLVPGVRPVGAALGDQCRVGSPGRAVNDGASLIVVGRPIRDATNPVEAAKAIAEEIQSAKGW